MGFLFQLLILEKTQYKTHNNKLLAIVNACKTWHHYSKGYKHNVLILTNYNNLRHFIVIQCLYYR